jgi:hypothetical protein
MTPEEANAYRQPMLDALGTDDPVEAQAAEVELWRRLLDDAGSALSVRPDPGEWSALECLGHMADSEMVTSVRYRLSVTLTCVRRPGSHYRRPPRAWL